MSIKVVWPFKYKIVGVSPGGYFGRLGKYDYYMRNGKKILLPHTGSDYPLPCGTILNSPDNGRIVQAYDPYPPHPDYYNGYGRFIRVKLNNGYQIGFAHLSQVWVKTGQIVKKGQRLGNTGNTGSGTGCHVHVELYNPSKKLVDPAKTIIWYNTGSDMADKIDVFRNVFITVNARWPTGHEVNLYKQHPEFKKNRPYTYVQQKYMYPNWVKKAVYNRDIAKLRGELEKVTSQAKTQIEVNTTLTNELRALQGQIKKQATEIAELKLQLATPPPNKDKPAIPRVSKNDGFWTRLWKRLIQFSERG